jgi:hypothetical protein
MSNTLNSLLFKLKSWIASIAVHFPKEVVNIRYFFRFGHFPNLHHPYDLNEKILYLKLYGDTTQWTRLADKYAVREYVASCGLGSILIPLYGVWEHAAEVPLDDLPQKFMLKANNGDGKGTNILVDKRNMTEAYRQQLYSKMEKWLSKRNIGALSAEPQYKNIPPRIIAEKVLQKNKEETSIIDYKIWCFNGRPYSILVCYNRQNTITTLGCYDLNWSFHPEKMSRTRHHLIAVQPIQRPKYLEKMLEIARVLSQPFPEVRVDLYEAEDKVWFGELTFTSLGGMMNYYTPEYLRELGRQVLI